MLATRIDFPGCRGAYGGLATSRRKISGVGRSLSDPDDMRRAGARFFGTPLDLFDLETRTVQALRERVIGLRRPHGQNASGAEHRVGSAQSARNMNGMC